MVSVQKTAKALNILVLAVLVCNVPALYLAPMAVYTGRESLLEGFLVYFREIFFRAEENIFVTATLRCAFMWGFVWFDFRLSVLTLLLLASGCSSAFILWQVRRVLKTVLRNEPFALENAVSLNRGAFGCFLLASTVLARVIFSMIYYHSRWPLTVYNALFVPMSAMGGFLCWVSSSLFRQAAEMEAENELTV